VDEDGNPDAANVPPMPLQRGTSFFYNGRGAGGSSGPFGLSYSFFYPRPGFLPGAPPAQSPTVKVLIHFTRNPQADSDGVDDDIETAGPLGPDANRDGMNDDQQPHVATLPSTTGSYVSLVAGGNTSLFGVQAIANPSPGDAPAGVEFPLGLFEYQVVGLAEGEGTTVSIVPQTPMLFTTYYKFGRNASNSQPHWYEFLYNGTTGAEFENVLDPASGQLITRRIILHLKDGGRGDDDRAVDGVITDPGGPGIRSTPQVERVVLGNGQAQRSRFMTVQVHFTDLVTLDRNAFELFLNNRRFVVSSFFTTTVEGKTVATLQFPAKSLSKLSLPDGRYRLVTKASAVHGRSGVLMATNRTDHFFRLFGDVTGDGVVNTADQTLFDAAFGSRSRKANYVACLDYDANGRIDAKDRAAFRARFGRSI
jgi:hypothetical protein